MSMIQANLKTNNKFGKHLNGSKKKVHSNKKSKTEKKEQEGRVN
jgi:hypothetical protein